MNGFLNLLSATFLTSFSYQRGAHNVKTFDGTCSERLSGTFVFTPTSVPATLASCMCSKTG